MSTSPPLGALSRLPYDVRHMIWGHFSPFDTFLLKVNSHLRQEVKDFLQDINICFTISPEHNKQNSRFPSAIKVHDQYKQYDTLYPPFFADGYCAGYCKNLLYRHKELARFKQYSKLPYRLLDSVTINIEAPVGPEDAGEFMRCWNSTCWLVYLLCEYCYAPSIDRLRLVFVETPERSWFDSSQLLKHSMEYEDCHDLALRNDLRWLLLPFSRFRACELTVELPQTPRLYLSADEQAWEDLYGECAKMQHFIATMQEDAAQKTPFVSYHSRFKPRVPKDYQVVRLQNTVTAWLDYCLDDIDTPCAKVLRAERLFFWGTAYRSAHRARLMPGQGANLRLLDETKEDLDEAFYERQRGRVCEELWLEGDPSCWDCRSGYCVQHP